MWKNKIYIFLLVIVFGAFTVVFDTFPRSTFSTLEKRDLATFPSLTWNSLTDGSFTDKVSSWFSDSVPFRDYFMALSMELKHLIKLSVSDDQVSFHATESSTEGEEPTNDIEQDERHLKDYKNKITAEENAKIANRGIIIVGKGDRVRALMAYGGSAKGGVEYAQAANLYQQTFGDKVQVYCMVIPTSSEFYCPESAKRCTNSQKATTENIFNHLDAKVKAVDIYSELAEHANEDIYLRTDHHWAPLGAYYAAQRFAKVAGVPFADLKTYTTKVVHRYVGSMYGYSKDAALKNAPEDFVYYEPNNVTYTTTYIDYKLDKNFKIQHESKPYQQHFFYHYKDGNGGAYCTFMGSDMRITKVSTSTHNHRRVLILKDSFGNPIPSFLFHSFEEIHVVDYRYFTKNMMDYVKQNHITDILFANNIFNAYSPKICNRYIKYLHQSDQLANQSVKVETKNDTKKQTKENTQHQTTTEKGASHKN